MMSEIFVKEEVYISDIISKEEKKRSDFIKGTINLRDMGKRKIYEVMICDLKDNSYLLKPIKIYKCLVFEELFGFDFECVNFDLQKRIKIKL